MFNKKYSTAGFVVVLALLVSAIYWQTEGFDFISLDDMSYVVDNGMVNRGLTWHGVRTAFTGLFQGSWMPLTWLSYMADVSVFGLDGGAMHRTNAVLFGLSAILLFLFLRSLTGSTWRSFFAAALWAAHPLRVESVAWVAERKDVLAGLFFILALWSHVNYARSRKIGWQAGTFGAMLLGLMSKPVVVVLPAALLLVDYWPLGRFREDGRFSLRRGGGLLLEKAHLFALSAGFIGQIIYANVVEAPLRPKNSLSNILVAANSYWRYLGRTFAPLDMVFEKTSLPVPGLTSVQILAVAGILAVTAGAWLLRKRAPEALFGWLWFLAVLSPNSGIVTVGMQTYSDRYTYLPHIGLAVALVWGIARLGEGFLKDKKVLAAAGAALVIVLSYQSHNLASYWSNSVTLFTHVDELYGGRNIMAKYSLATEHLARGDFERALFYLREVERMQPYFPNLNYNTAFALHKLGRNREALQVISRDDRHGGQKESTLLKREILQSLDAEFRAP